MLPRKFIHVGEIFVGIRPTEIVTVLGSCVGVCLYDRVEMIGAMNHYLLPLWNGNGLGRRIMMISDENRIMVKYVQNEMMGND